MTDISYKDQIKCKSLFSFDEFEKKDIKEKEMRKIEPN
jgi:hypothetical protein